MLIPLRCARHFVSAGGLALLLCGGCGPELSTSSSAPQSLPLETSSPKDPFTVKRHQMVDEDIAGRDIHDARVLDAMKRVPRHAFVPFDWQEQAYTDRPLPIGHEQTISQPYIVALMTELAEPERDDRALDVGTGSGYQAAILAELVDQVYSIEIVPELAEEAKDRLHDQGYENISFRIGDGFQGWPEAAPFDLIILAAAAAEVPPALIDQLAPGGRMVLPVGDRFGQKLLMIKKDSRGEIERRVVAPVSFVPMTGQARQPKP